MADETQPGAGPQQTGVASQDSKGAEVAGANRSNYTTAADKVGGAKPKVETYHGFPIPPRAPSPPVISTEDYETAMRVQKVLDGEEKDNVPPGETKSEAWERITKEGSAYWRVSIGVEEAQEIDRARDLAKKFGLDPDRAYNDSTFRRDLDEADRICTELGLDGREVFANEEQRRTLQLLIRSDVRVRGDSGNIQRIQEELDAVTKRLNDKLAEARAMLGGEQTYNEQLKNNLLGLAGKASNQNASNSEAGQSTQIQNPSEK